MNKLLILLIFLTNIALAEPIVCDDGVIENVLITLHYVGSYEELEEMAGSPVEGFSLCERQVDKNMAWCDVYILEPKVVDGDHILTFGHEVFHGVCGVDYHDA